MSLYYMSPEELLAKGEIFEVGFAFGRYDLKLPYILAELYRTGIIAKIAISGGLGKESGPLLDFPGQPVSEAAFLGVCLLQKRISETDIFLETKASNGGENSCFGTLMMRDAGFKLGKVLLLGHPVSLLRLELARSLEARKILGHKTEYALCPTTSDNMLQDLTAEWNRIQEWPHRPEGAWSNPLTSFDYILK